MCAEGHTNTSVSLYDQLKSKFIRTFYAETKLHARAYKHEPFFVLAISFAESVEWLHERIEQVPQLWNWENQLHVKPVTRQNILSCLVPPPEIVMHDALMLFSESPPMYASCMTISGERTEQQVVIGFGELAAVN